MHTLQEFLMYTKAFEYLVAIAFILAFIVFWSLLTRQRPAVEKADRIVESSKVANDEESSSQL